MTEKPLQKRRCAVYTRKSSEEGLEQEFNSLTAQREACEAFIASQKHEGWVLVPDRYDDGGVSGGTLERPAFQRLLKDVEAGRVDNVVVYKVDRLTRSLADFAKIVEVFERNQASFVSVTQAFNTTTSMGRLTLNILLSFAQFERELASERIRDKFAAARKKGIWMGGMPPLGYDVKDRKLVINEPETELVRRIFTRFLRTGSALKVAQELNSAGHTTKRWTTTYGNDRGGRAFTKGGIYKILKNRVYIGEAVHKDKAYPGQHKAIVDRETWDQIHAILAGNARTRGNQTRAQTPALLKGLIHGPNGKAMSPTHTRKNGRLYRYYVTREALSEGYDTCPVRSVPAAEVEAVVITQLRAFIRSPELVARTWAAVRERADEAIPEREVLQVLTDFEGLWDELFHGEQSRVVQLLVERVDVQPDGIEVRIRTEGFRSLIEELGGGQDIQKKDAA